MKITNMKNQTILATAILLLSLSRAQALSIPQAGTLNITILDQEGVVVPHAPVYIYGEAKTKFAGGQEIAGSATLNMAPGTYRISSAITRQSGDYFDRFASREAHVEIVAGDNTIVTLRLHALANTETNISEGDVSTINVGQYRSSHIF